MPDALLSARVPVLILQPIVENAVKYGVAKSRKPVTVRISAYEEAGRLHIKVKDDGEAAAAGRWRGAAPASASGTSATGSPPATAIAPAASHGADPDGGYTVHIFMPVVTQWLRSAPLRVMVVDDEPLAVERLQLLLARCAGVAVVGTANDGEAALRIAEAVSPDLVLLDIAMPGMDGIDVARALSESRGRPGGGVRHRVRQFRGGRLRRRRDRLSDEAGRARPARARARAGRAPISPAAAAPARRRPPAHVEEFWVPDHSGLVRIAATDIERITAERDYMRLHVGARSWLIHRTIAKLEEDLDPDLFIRVHRSVILRRDTITGLYRDDAGHWTARLRRRRRAAHRPLLCRRGEEAGGAVSPPPLPHAGGGTMRKN